MKKIVFAFAVILAAGFCQAAAVKWAASAITGSGAAAGNMVCLYYTDAGAGSDVVLNAIKSGTAPAASAGMTISLSKGKVAATIIDLAALDTSKAYDFYVVAFDASTVAAAANYQMVAKTEITYSTLDSIYNVSASFSGQSWTAKPSEGVPEPTSGLLLVLGGAMLALRRRRA